MLLCIHTGGVHAADTVKVMVSIVPQKYFVEKIGGDLVDVSVMVLPGASPATYEPKPQQMVALMRAQMYFAMGVPFERVWLEKFTRVNPEIKIIHTQDGIEKRPMEHHSHGGATDRNRSGEKPPQHGTEDPHIWLSPPLVQIQSRNILEAFLRIDPENRERYTANYDAFAKEIVDLDRLIKEIFKDKGRGSAFMVYHPSWGYFAESYGLEQIPVELEGKEPKGRQLQRLIELSRKENIQAIFVQPQFSRKSANTIAKAVGCSVINADPLAENWSENLLSIADKFSRALTSKPLSTVKGP